MTRKFNFGKVDGYSIGRKTCAVELEFGFREFSGQEPYFTVCANVWNNIHTDIIWGGQCVDTIAKSYRNIGRNALYKEIAELWKKYHLKKISDIPQYDVDRINEILATA